MKDERPKDLYELIHGKGDTPEERMSYIAPRYLVNAEMEMPAMHSSTLFASDDYGRIGNEYMSTLKLQCQAQYMTLEDQEHLAKLCYDYVVQRKGRVEVNVIYERV